MQEALDGPGTPTGRAGQGRFVLDPAEEDFDEDDILAAVAPSFHINLCTHAQTSMPYR